MAYPAPGKHHRKGLSLMDLMKMFPDDEAASYWIEKVVWPDGPRCPKCGSSEVQSGIKHKSMTHRCLSCEGQPRFSVRMGTVMQSSKLGYRMWAIAVCGRPPWCKLETGIRTTCDMPSRTADWTAPTT